MSNLRRIGNQMTIPIPRDAEGFIGRECPQPDCRGYFKIQPGKGLKGTNLPSRCPYCGHVDQQAEFNTQDQIDYAKSVAVHEITNAIHKDLKALEFNRPPTGPFGIGMSLTVQDRTAYPIRYYREQRLETTVVCEKCSLRYSIYGVFGYCPDCGAHNSRQILEKNLELAAKELTLADSAEPEVANYLIADALENAVSAFDGFGRETCCVHAAKSTDPARAERLSFQKLASARQRLKELFGLDLVHVGRNRPTVSKRPIRRSLRRNYGSN